MGVIAREEENRSGVIQVELGKTMENYQPSLYICISQSTRFSVHPSLPMPGQNDTDLVLEGLAKLIGDGAAASTKS